MTSDMSLADLVRHLSIRNEIDALAIVGSASESRLQPASDYDLLIVLDQPEMPFVGGVTHVEGRLADIVFAKVEDIEAILESGDSEIAFDDIRGTIVRWMRTALIEIDRGGRLQRLQEKASSDYALKNYSEGEKQSRLDKASYNLAHTQRMLRSDDTVYHEAIDLRMLYQLADLMVDYFHVRDMPWEGEKAAIRYWRGADPEYHNLFRRCETESELLKRVELYGELVSRTMSPIGRLWTEGATNFRLAPDSAMTTKNLEAARTYWQQLVGSEDD